MYYDFKKDLAYSEKSINDVIDILTSKGHVIESIGKTSDFDLKVIYKDREFLYEVKDDVMSSKTNNVAIEVSKFDEEILPSGLYVTKSFYWIQNVKNEYRIIRVEILKDLINNCSFKSVWGGDNKQTKLVLIPIEIFLEYSKEFK